MKIIIARKLLPISRPPINNGAICIKDGKITDIGPRKRILYKYGSARAVELGGMVVMPGLVNTHAHLELSHLHGRLGECDGFFEWIERLIQLRRKAGETGLKKAAARALKDAIRSGTTCIGDISATELALPGIVKSGVRALVFLEIIGLDKSNAEPSYRRLLKRIDAVNRLSERIEAGISPHSPYSVSDSLYNMIAKYISDNRLKLAVHLSETIDENKHISGKASSMDSYMSMAGWEKHKTNRAHSPFGFIMGKGIHKGLLAVHAVHVSTRDIRDMADAGVSVAHCPRSNHMLGVGRAPVARMMKAGINVALGTDSLASNMDMDMWEEMRFACLVNRLSAENIIRMATLNGAKALELDSLTGSLEPGKAADIIAVRGRAATATDPYTPLLYDTRPGDVALGMVEGRVIHKEQGLRL